MNEPSLANLANLFPHCGQPLLDEVFNDFNEVANLANLANLFWPLMRGRGRAHGSSYQVGQVGQVGQRIEKADEIRGQPRLQRLATSVEGWAPSRERP
ncbi:MAG: hypothetical protein KAG89_12240 [Fulvimarina manganoxydans]|uniref:hypothetical protein n=1 Tax=Fulvimarina manganoxydans TaxID=937218 RepID=UPI00235256C2|nr:hypothetical protein [Fulvimarina manganoxydans]MCK5932928.1 hypothetical protein [Fulvimarina manganoxydans]